MDWYLYHYFEASSGPFRNLSDLSIDEAEKVQDDIRRKGVQFASKRSEDYVRIRVALEALARKQFISLGGNPQRKSPHYMTLGECAWIKEWYEQGAEIKIPLHEFDADTVSFTYGDLFPTMRYNDGKPYRKKVYTLKGIRQLIAKYDWPQKWNPDGQHGPERYIEAQVWDDTPLQKYIPSNMSR